VSTTYETVPAGWTENHIQMKTNSGGRYPGVPTKRVAIHSSSSLRSTSFTSPKSATCSTENNQMLMSEQIQKFGRLKETYFSS